MPTETRLVQQAYKYALDPTPAQARAFASHAGGARYAYNWGLAQITEALDAYAAEKAAGAEKPTTRVPGHFELCKRWTEFKNDPASDVPWVGQNFVGTYQAALRDATAAWKRFFDSRSGKVAGRRVGRPRFKSKHRARRSFQLHGDGLRQHCREPGAPERRVAATPPCAARPVPLRGQLQPPGTCPQTRRPAPRRICGTGDGVLPPGPAGRGSAGPVRPVASRTSTAGADRRHGRVADLRHDALSKAASELVHSYARIAVEGWDIQQTLQHGSADLPRKIARDRNRALASAGLGELRWMLQSRSSWYGSTVMVADRHQETGRTCSACGTVRTKPVPQAEEQFTCPACGYVADRRVNTARALAAWAGAQTDAPSGGEWSNARGGDVRPAASRRGGRSPTKREASTRPHRRGETGTPGP